MRGFPALAARYGFGPLALLAASCSGASGTALNVSVQYRLTPNTGTCLKVGAAPAKPSGQTRLNAVLLDAGTPLEGSLKFGILEPGDWSGEVTVTASLHHPNCAAQPNLTQTQRVLPAGVMMLTFSLDETATDAGTDAGFDAGSDGGTDAGTDGGDGGDGG